ncbi:predicted protein [Naegleria gruberi]|uniref:Predicted protein n=1 Tax=Naegleria gruberi TaxID=5762 RepID=D2VPF8_NAEGR|nr:uncharacterized protein NAEGRDRAFT_70845 [Naegleria gruberi]EFC41423.1 predicted protein [Naegleria gruberi]|eukprot:XP_002674167.1 predicted protein [Naegleria gruberi strain NEG-M]
MLNRIISTAPHEHGEEHISFSKHEQQHVNNSLQNYSKLVSNSNHGHTSSHNLSNNFEHQRSIVVLPPPTTSPLTSTITTIVSSPHVKYHQQVDVSNNLNQFNKHGSCLHSSHVNAHHSNVSSPTNSHPQGIKAVAVASTSGNHNISNIVNFPITNKGVNDSKSKDNQTFIVDYMFKETAGIKKSKKIKRKYEFKRKEGTVSNEVEKPTQTKVSYVIMDDEELDACESMNELLEKHFSEGETCFNYSKDQRVSIVQIDSNVKFTRKRTVENITTDEMIRILHLTQQQACTLLGCSLSTIKRKFYSIRNELGIDKWPHNYLEYRHYSFFDDFYPMSMKFILNDKDQHAACNNENESNNS